MGEPARMTSHRCARPVGHKKRIRVRRLTAFQAMAVSLWPLLAVPAPTPPSFMSAQETEQLAAGTYAFRQGAYRSLFLIGENGVIVTDPVSPQYAAAMRAAIAKLTDAPVRFVVYSHSHWDRISGGRIFADEGASFIAQERCTQNLRETPNPLVIPPDITYRTEYQVRVGDKALDLHYLGPGLDNCLSVIVAQPAKIMMIVGLVNAPHADLPRNPTVPDYQLWNIVPFFRAAEQLARQDGIERLVGGFIAIGNGPDGQPLLQPSTGPIAAVGEQRLFWEQLIGAVKAQHDAGTPLRDVMQKLDLTSFRQYPRYSERRMEILVRRVGSLLTTGR